MKRNNAFTLIELLISIVIFSMLIGLVVYTFRGVLRLYEKDIRFDINSFVRLAKVRECLKSTFYYVVNDANTKKNIFHFYFSGDQKSVYFITKSSFFFDEISLVNLFCDDNSLRIKEAPLYNCFNNYQKPYFPNSITKTEIIIKDINNCYFRYIKNGKMVKEINKYIPDAIVINIVKNGRKFDNYIKIFSSFDRKKIITNRLYDDY